jgi:tetratricopeptide (TPR) repeat protein
VKKTVHIALIFFLITGCASLKQGWKNFTAYYNTFYNAQQYYDEGLKNNKRQLPDINPILPVRVHQPPTSAGLDEFESTIDRGSSILRNHDESKYVLPAIAIIGKSYYYRSEYFSALEKFQELQTLADGELLQEAVLWQGLTYLEMNNYNEGVRFLELEIDLIDDWNPNLLAETYAVLAQLHTAKGNWQEAVDYLQYAISDLEDRNKRARAFFLLGQCHERLDEDNQALYAFGQISGIRTEYDLEFNALRKEAEVSRRIGGYQRAESIYNNMYRDDKFYEYRNELRYEIARTQQFRGDPELAMENYNRVLRDRIQNPSSLTRAKTYFSLGEIYRDMLEDYTLAASYFDSAASERVDPNLLPEGFNASELAESFGQYAGLKRELASRDSLLNLAMMPPDELNAFVEELQRIEMERLEEELSQMEAERGRVTVVQEPDSVIEATESTEFGFLNIRSQAMLADASLQFQAIWGDRPLADNWRRRADVSGSRFDQLVLVDEENEEITIEEETETGSVMPAIDLSDVPFSEEEQQAMLEEIEDIHYRLGNVFFLSLDKADSARTYYQKVTESAYNPHLVTMSLYSLAEIGILQNDPDKTHYWFNRLYEKRPESVYTRRIADRLGIDITEEEPEQDEPRIEDQYFNLVNNAEEMGSAERAAGLLDLANNGSNDSQRAMILFEAAREYMRAAKFETDNQQVIREWFERQQDYSTRKNEFELLQDSSRVMLNDTTLTETEMQFWQQIADSTFTGSEPHLMENYPFEGAYWDSTRTILDILETEHASSSVIPRVQVLQETLKKPEESQIVLEPLALFNNEDDEFVETEEVASCSELGIAIDLYGGMDEFMSSITFPSWTQNLSMRGEISYRFGVEPDGTIGHYEQMSSMDRSGIPQSIENAIEQILRFTETGSDTTVVCMMTFPIEL